MERDIAKANWICNEAIQYFFQFVYCIGKIFIPFNNFSRLFILLVSVYFHGREFVSSQKLVYNFLFFGISSIMQKKVTNQIEDLKFYNVMIDELIDISMTNHLVVFITFVEEGMLWCVFIGPLHIDGGKKDA